MDKIVFSTDEQKRAIKSLKRAVKKINEAGLCAFMSTDSGPSLVIFNKPLPFTNNGAVDQFQSIDSVNVSGWDAGLF